MFNDKFRYFSNGCQIIPPHDSGIAASILQNLEPESWDKDVVDSANPLVEAALKSVKAAYFKAVGNVAGMELPPEGLRFVYTPMHGVGLPYMKEAVQGLGLLEHMIVVEQQVRQRTVFQEQFQRRGQATPDPNFTTVKFPNPEEKGALELAFHTADQHSINLVIANDPDADRLAVAEKVR